MMLSELIEKLKEQEDLGYGNLKVCYDFGAVEVDVVKIDEHYNLDCELEKYVHLDWC